MKTIYAIYEYGDFKMFSTNPNTVFGYWWRERTKVDGARPDIARIYLNQPYKMDWLGAQEITDYCNKYLFKKEEIRMDNKERAFLISDAIDCVIEKYEGLETLIVSKTWLEDLKALACYSDEFISDNRDHIEAVLHINIDYYKEKQDEFSTNS